MASEIMKRIIGMSDFEIFEANVPSISSADDVFYPKGTVTRQSVRISAKMIVGPEDLNEKRKYLAENIPAALRLPKK